MPNAITGINDTLLGHLGDSMRNARSIRMIIAFLMESGARLLGEQLLAAAQRGVKIQILTGTYMAVTEPSAIYYLWEKLGSQVEIRFFNEPFRSFHPKAYLFESATEGEIYVGSSNISKSALTVGVEWNYRLTRHNDPESYDNFSQTFHQLYENQAVVVTEALLKQYALSWKKPLFAKAEGIETLPQERPEPTGAQLEALYYLNRAREEGLTKGLVIAATGVGKTYLAVFDSLPFARVLFVAHREEILQQAERSFRAVRPEVRIGYCTGTQQDQGMEVCLATIQTLGRENHLPTFPPEYFDYIVLDEFHHVAANSYRKLLAYFKPRFLLGLTATPFRTDNRDIYGFCDDNVIYELYLKDAINRDLLVPFKYYGIYDATDYEQIDLQNGKYATDQLERELSRQERAHLVLEKYHQFAGVRTMGFCVSIGHAEYMAEYFSWRGVAACAVHSGGITSRYTLERHQAIQAMGNGTVKVIFAVDLFNEGVDIPALDTVMFLRPTESFTVFLQQLGRGLRKYDRKAYLTVLDFIGNYRRAHYIPALLAGENPMLTRGPGNRVRDLEYPEGCQVQFDFQVLDLFAELARRDPLAHRMREAYFQLKQELQRRPRRTELYESTDIPFREFMREGWLGYLQSLGELTEEEAGWREAPVWEFIREVERTALTKAYKLPTIGALLSSGTLLPQVSLEAVARNFRRFYHDNPLHQKDLNDQSNRDWRSWDLARFGKLAKANPIHFLAKGKCFWYDEVNQRFGLDPVLTPYLGPTLADHISDILEYRRLDFFKRRYRDAPNQN
ncbi:MAG TPA: DEAD/DEAH box helicase family protein [Bacillota bacterium]|nr:DEAD/DEAH box helicase family protein [Bacillota bacterium]